MCLLLLKTHTIIDNQCYIKIVCVFTKNHKNKITHTYIKYKITVNELKIYIFYVDS